MPAARTTKSWQTRFLRALTCVLAALPGLPAAADFPTQPVKVVVPFVAGGGIDIVARLIAPRLGEALGQPVIIENRGGAGGALGAAAVAQAEPDGYTLLLGTGSTHGTNSAVNPKLSYDPIKGFAPIVLVYQSPLLLVVPPSLGVGSVTELVALARSKPGALNYGSYGLGSINHLSAELFNAMAGIDTRHVPYRGSSPALVDLIGGRIDFVLDGVSTSIGYVSAGTLRLLGVTGTRRIPLLPDAPTVSDSGVPGYETSVWCGLFAPAQTPTALISLLNAKVNTVLGFDDVKAGFARVAFEPMGGAPGVLAERVQAEIAKWARLVKERNIQVTP